MATTTTPQSTEKKSSDHKQATLSLAEQLADLDRQMDALQAKKLELNQKAIHEQKLKISDLQKLLREEQEKLDLLTGKPSDAPKKSRRPRTTPINDDALKDQITKMMASFGAEGMNAKQIAERVHQDPIRIRKYIKDFPQALKRTGAGPGTKFFLP